MSGTDILREVDESLRVDKAMKFWRDYGSTLIIVAAILVLGTAAQALWTTHKESTAEKSTEAFLNAAKESDPVAGFHKLAAEKDGTGSALAGLNAAALLLTQEKWTDAIANYELVLDNKSAPQSFKDLAAIQIVSLKLDHDDKATADDLLKSLAPVLNNKNSEWQSRALLVSALIKAHKQNDYAGAQKDLKSIRDLPNVADSYLEKVDMLDKVYQLKSTPQK